MQNDPHFHGERLARLEERYEDVLNRLNHLDECLDGAKVKMAEHVEEVREKMRIWDQTWDRRWWVGLGFIAAIVFISGSGFVSLKQLVELIAKIGH